MKTFCIESGEKAITQAHSKQAYATQLAPKKGFPQADSKLMRAGDKNLLGPNSIVPAASTQHNNSTLLKFWALYSERCI